MFEFFMIFQYSDEIIFLQSRVDPAEARHTE